MAQDLPACRASVRAAFTGPGSRRERRRRFERAIGGEHGDIAITTTFEVSPIPSQMTMSGR